MAPAAPQRASLEKDSRPYARTIMNGKMANIEDQAAQKNDEC
jgi:hypothetical protein